MNTRPRPGDCFRIGANGWRVVRLSRTRAWCEPLQKGRTARWLYLEVLESPALAIPITGDTNGQYSESPRGA